MPSWPLQRIGEVLVDGQWVSLPLREENRVTITRGMGAEGTVARPGSTTVRVNDPDAVYSPRNVESSLYAKFGQGSRFRFRVDDPPAVPAAVLADTFDRTVANGWGSSSSGTAWVIWDPFAVSPPASEYAVTGSRGTITTVTKAQSRYIRTSGLALSDFEATFTVSTDTTPDDSTAENGIVGTAVLRIDPTARTSYLANILLMPPAGLPGTLGQRVAVNFNRTPDDLNSTAFQQIPGLVWSVNAKLCVRVRAEGPDLRLRVWRDGTPEPGHWHAQHYDDRSAAGEFGFRASIFGAGTPTPAAVSFDDLEVRPLVTDDGAIRLTGEIAGVDSYEDENGPAAAYVDLEVAGVLRRYEGPQKPIRGALRRRMSIYGPRGYWAFEEGAQGDTRVAEVGEQSTTGPMTVTGLEFARDDTLFGSAPLPTVRAGSTLRVDGIQGSNTGYWAVYFMVRAASATFPMDGAYHEILSFTTGTAEVTVSLRAFGGNDPGIWITVRTFEGTTLGPYALLESSLSAFGRSLLDRWSQVKIYAVQTGADTVVTLALRFTDGGNLLTSLPADTFAADRPRRIDTVFGPGIQDLGFGHLSVWGVAFTSAFTSVYTDLKGQVFVSYDVGAPGLRARDWMSQLACEQAAALDAYGPGSTLMGPYPRDSFIALAQLAAETDAGLLVEHRDQIGLRYLSRQSLYNRPVELVLDYASGMVFAPFEPKDDDKDVYNRITVRRRAGSEATAELATGRRSVQPAPDGMGVKDTSVETIVRSDDQLPSQAGWRLHVAAWDEMRLASITLKMANPRLRPLIDTVLKLREGSRVLVINTPRRYGPDGFDLLVRGTKEVHAEGVFDLTLTCSPYGPYRVGALAYVEDFEDTTYQVPVSFGGNQPWARSQLHYNTGSWSMRSGPITNNQTSDLRIGVPAGMTEMRFWYWTDSEASGPGFAGDRLLVLADGVQVLTAQGTTPWTQAIVDVTGRSEVIFRYVKDNSASSGEDAVHVDDLSFTGRAAARADTRGSVLLAAAAAADTQLLVASPGVQPWATSPVWLPLDLKMGGEEVRATAISSWAADAFGRTTASGWGAADTGQTWTVAGGAGASDFSVGSGYGSHLLGTVNVSRRAVVPFTYPDVDVAVSITTSATATGGSLYGGPVARYLDGDNLYHLRVEVTTGNQVLLDLRKRVAAVESSVATRATVITHAAGTFLRARLQVAGTTLRAKVWPAAAPEPRRWHIVTQDTSLTTSASVGVRSISAAANTNVNPSLRYDAFEVLSPQLITVRRSRNNVTKAHPAGTALSLARPAIVPL